MSPKGFETATKAANQRASESTRTERADEAARERACRGVRGAKPLGIEMILAILASVALGAASTFGDMLWAGLSLRHRMGYGLLHGAAICLLIGVFVGWRAGRPLSGLAAGPVVGLIAAGAFYVLAPWMRYYAMFPAWMLFWICFAALQKLLSRQSHWGFAVLRGLIAAICSGAAFYAISGIWTNPPREGPRYLYNFLAWTVAFAPGFAALFAGAKYGRSADSR